MRILDNIKGMEESDKVKKEREEMKPSLFVEEMISLLEKSTGSK